MSMNPAESDRGLELPTSTVELSMWCENLMDADILSKSDPVCVVHIKDSKAHKQWVTVGKTEIIKDSLNPRWQKKFIMDYKFEERQCLKFSVYDWDTETQDIESQDFLGSMECTFGEIVSKQSTGFTKFLAGGKLGKIHVTAEELSENKEHVCFKMSAAKLDRMDWFGKSDPFMEIHRSVGNNQFTLVHRTEMVKSNLNPEWKPIKISVRSLTNGEDGRDLRFDVFDWNRNGEHKLIGSFSTTLEKLRKGPGNQNIYDCISKEKMRKKGSSYENSGTITLHSISFEIVPSFLDYIHGGTQVNFTVAIDFTGSNGNPNNPDSLHYKDPNGKPNQYVTAIQAVGEIILDYDSDQMVPALGFGARIPPTFQVAHEFFLTQDNSNPFCHGMDGILSAYYKSLHSVQLYGPTNFSPIINHVAKFASVNQTNSSEYFILLIITDGIITDFEDSKRSIIRASSLPMSIIIIGVGEENFSSMEELDCDESLLKSGSLVALRDIVQFVELRKFVTKNGWHKEHLAREVLAEIPGQLLSYMKQKGFPPPTPNSSHHNQNSIQTDSTDLSANNYMDKNVNPITQVTGSVTSGVAMPPFPNKGGPPTFFKE